MTEHTGDIFILGPDTMDVINKLSTKSCRKQEIVLKSHGFYLDHKEAVKKLYLSWSLFSGYPYFNTITTHGPLIINGQVCTEDYKLPLYLVDLKDLPEVVTVEIFTTKAASFKIDVLSKDLPSFTAPFRAMSEAVTILISKEC